MRRPSSADFP
jgi:hypothetical protein